MRSSPLLSVLRALSQLCKYTWIVCAIGAAVAWQRKGELPEYSKISAELSADPEQLMVNTPPFSFDYRSVTYRVEPVAEYDIRGVVVSHNDISAWWDMYHDANSVDLKDLCLVWGDNLKGSLYKKAKFYSESVSCNWMISDGAVYARFREDQISNNHLLSDSENIRQKIREAQVGDQIQLRGWLINYSRADAPEYKRSSSLTRKDTAGFACEVMFVKEFRSIRKAPRFWFTTAHVAKSLGVSCFLIYLLLVMAIPYLEFRYE